MYVCVFHVLYNRRGLGFPQGNCGFLVIKNEMPDLIVNYEKDEIRSDEKHFELIIQKIQDV